jgi:dienelactone hydrolase
MKLYFDDEGWDGQLQRSVGKCDTGMANVGECLYVASQIVLGDRDSWYREWSSFAVRLVDQGDAALAAGHRITARDCYLRACEYFRQAFFWHRDDLEGVELTTAYAASVSAFHKALPLLAHRATILEGDTPGYLFEPEGDGPFPTILHVGGYDGTAEEIYSTAPYTLDRGWAYVALDGPGTGLPLYERRVPMRPDWEHVVPGMVDLVLQQARVDPARIVLAGRSFGGFLAPRGASGEPRLAALVADPGQIDMAAGMQERLGDLATRVHDPSADEEFEALRKNPALDTFLGPRMATHGVTGVREYLADMMRFTSREQVPLVTCPSFITDNETDVVSTGQGQQLYDALTCPKEFRRFLRSEGAEGHCEGMAAIVFWAAAFDWLERTLA